MLPGQVFLDATRDRVPDVPEDRGAEWAVRAYWSRDDVPFHLPLKVATSPVGYAVVNHGRWIVRCPFGCGGAQLACRTDHRFLCVNCLNEGAGGQWVAVEWPDDVAGVEDALRPRMTANANTDPGETVADLITENAERGV